jgi:hypothetical protein
MKWVERVRESRSPCTLILLIQSGTNRAFSTVPRTGTTARYVGCGLWMAARCGTRLVACYRLCQEQISEYFLLIIKNAWVPLWRLPGDRCPVAKGPAELWIAGHARNHFHLHAVLTAAMFGEKALGLVGICALFYAPGVKPGFPYCAIAVSTRLHAMREPAVS